MRILLLFVVLVTLLSGRHVFAQTIHITDSVDEWDRMPYELSILIDTTNTLSFSEISSGKFSDQFKSYPSYQNKDFREDASYWIRFPIRHNPNSEKIWI